MSAADHLQPEQFHDIEMHAALSDLANAIYSHLPDSPRKRGLIASAMNATSAEVQKIPERYGKS
jgi:hypothetical protein